MMNSLSRWWLGVGVLGALTGCGKPVSKSDLPGTYVADYGFATDTVTIKDNGQFNQSIKVKSSDKVAVTNGTWRFEPNDRNIYFSEAFMVVVNGFSEMATNFDHPTNKAISILPVRRSFGKLEIGGDDIPWGRSGAEAPYKKQAVKAPK